MPTQLQPYSGYTGHEEPVVTPADVVAELGKLVTENAPEFTDKEREALFGKWITIEKTLALEFVEWDSDSENNTAAEIIMLEEYILFRVCARALRHAQINRRVGVEGYAPSYVYEIEEFDRRANSMIDVVMKARLTNVITFTWIQENYPDIWTKRGLPADTRCPDE